MIFYLILCFNIVKYSKIKQMRLLHTIFKKWDSDFSQKYEIHILVKKTIFNFSFSVVV